jgi:hypothetical protein
MCRNMVIFRYTLSIFLLKKLEKQGKLWHTSFFSGIFFCQMATICHEKKQAGSYRLFIMEITYQCCSDSLCWKKWYWGKGLEMNSCIRVESQNRVGSH